MKNNRLILPFIILLLVVFLPASAYLVYNKVILNKGQVKEEEGYFYIYDSNNNMLGKYYCPANNCSISSAKVDINSEEEAKIEPSNDYVFLKINEMNILYNYKTNNGVTSVKEIYTYNNIIKDSYVVKNNEDKYGILSTNPVGFSIPAEYDLISINTDISESVDKVIVQKDGSYKIINLNNEELYNTDNEIIFYNNDVVVVKRSMNSYYEVYKYDNSRVFLGDIITNILVYNDNYYYQDIFKNVKVYDKNFNLVKSDTREEEVNFEISNNEVIY